MKNEIFYITSDGLDKMMGEMQKLEREKNQKLKQEVRVLDRVKKTDSEYIDSFEELGFIRKRLSEIRNIITNARLIPKKSKNGVITLGAKVTLEDQGSKKLMSFKIVDSLEVNPAEGKISRNSPLGSALLGHRINEMVSIKHPANKNYFIKNIKYTN